MDPMMELFFILWMLVLPIVAIVLLLVVPIFWFLIVPKIARKLTWERFRKLSYHLIADDSGYAYLLSTKEELPEGIVNTEKGFRFLPRSPWMKGNPSPKDSETKHVENLMLRKFFWKDMGKPMWFGYAGKVPSVNPATLAGLQQTEDKPPDTSKFIDKIIDYLKVLGQPHRKELASMLKSLKEGLAFKSLTVIDPTKIKEVIPKMFTPSQLDALATNREQRGMKRAGKQYTGLILGIGLILAILIFGTIAFMTFVK